MSKQALQPDDQTARERRRNRRFTLSVPAIISQPDCHDLSCEIRDFCVGGLFLQFTHPEIAIGVLARRANAIIDVTFSADPDSSTPPLHIQAQIKRLAPQGLGVAFVKIPREALRALQRQRMAGQRQSLGKPPAKAARAQRIAILRSLLVDALDHSLDLLDSALESHLAVAAMRASGISEHGALLRAPLLFREHSADIRRAMCDYVLQRLDRPDTLPGNYDSTMPGNLELVDEFDFEDWLATTTEAARIEDLFHAELAEIEPRLAQLTGFSYSRSTNPFGPDTFLHALRTAIEPMDLPMRARQVAYAALREALQDAFSPLYAELLALLPAAEVRSFLRKPSSGSAAPGQGRAESPGVYTGASLQTQPTASGALARLTDTLMGFFRGPGGTASPAVVAATHPPQASDAADLTASVLQRLANAGALPAQPDPVTQQSLGLFGTLFDTLEHDKLLGSSARPFFRQLESTLVRIALTDPAFLTSPSHPAHRALNTLDRLCRVAGDDGEVADERLLRLMNRWADRINAEAERNPGVFDEARIQLERVIAPLLRERNARVFRLQELCEGRQYAEDQRRAIVRSLYRRVGDAPVAQLVIDLWNGGWRNVLLTATLRGDATAEWNILDTLIAWLAVKPAELPTVSGTQRLLRQIDSNLARVCADKSTHDHLLDQLSQALLDRSPGLLRPTTLAARLGEAIATPELDTFQTRTAERLRIGDWLDFKGRGAPLNLIWRGDEPPVYVFANYRGYKKLDLRQADLLRALENGDARWADDQELPLMDRTYSAMILKMQNDLVRQLETDPQTGLLNFPSFVRAQRRAWLRCPESQNGYMVGTVVFDTLPDDQLAALAERLRAHLPHEALAARADSGSMVWWQAAASPEAALAYARAVEDSLVTPAMDAGNASTFDGGVGVLWCMQCLDPARDFERSRRAADTARVAGTVTRADTEPADFGSERLTQWNAFLDEVLHENRLSLICHPAMTCRMPENGVADEPGYFELYLHVEAREDQLIPARDLLLIAERVGRQNELDLWVLNTALSWMRAHPERCVLLAGFVLPVSAQALADPAYFECLSNALADGDIAENKLIFALNEATAAEGHALTHRFLRQLQRQGCRFMLDAFVGGQSAFPYLKSLQLDFIKIDRTLTRDLETSEVDEALVRSIVETARYLGIKTVAAQVESLPLRAKLDAIGVDLIQGYALATPVLLEDLNTD